MTALAQYHAARAAIAAAIRIDQAKAIRDEMEHVKLYAKQVKDKELLADASEIQLRAERRLGELLLAAEKTGQLQPHGRPRKAPPGKKGTDPEPFLPATLSEIGVDKKTSAKTKKTAAIAEPAFEAMVQATRERIVAGRAAIISPDLVNGARAIAPGRAEPDDSLDYFRTPPWATRALVEIVFPEIGIRDIESVWEPACGEGHMAEVLREYCAEVKASDVHDYGYGQVINFLIDPLAEASARTGWIITNPPFNERAEDFVLRGLERASVGVAMFFRLQRLETIGRYERIFAPFPPTIIAQFAERVPLCKGRWNPDGSTQRPISG